MKIASSGQELKQMLLEDCHGSVPDGRSRFGTEIIILTTAREVNEIGAAFFSGTGRAGGIA